MVCLYKSSFLNLFEDQLVAFSKHILPVTLTGKHFEDVKVRTQASCIAKWVAIPRFRQKTLDVRMHLVVWQILISIKGHLFLCFLAFDYIST